MLALATTALGAGEPGPVERAGFAPAFDPADGAVAIAGRASGTVLPPLRVRLCGEDGVPSTRGVACDMNATAQGTIVAAWKTETTGRSIEATLDVDADGAIRIRPGAGLGGVVVETPLDYAVLPSRFVEDTIYQPRSYPPGSDVHVPPENLVMGLCGDGARIVVLAWPGAARAVIARRDADPHARPRFAGMRVMLKQGPLHLGVFDGAGIWFEAMLDGAPLDQELPQRWKPPHKARWLTQLTEKGDFPTSYEIRAQASRKRSFWRAGFGYYTYPAWLGPEGLMFEFCDKVHPQGVALVYALDDHPQTPFEFLRARFSPEERRPLTELLAVRPVRDGDFVPPGPGPGWARACFGRNRMECTILRVGLQYRERALLEQHFRFRAREARGPETQNQLYADFIADAAPWLARLADRPGGARAYVASMRPCLAALEEAYRDSTRGGTPAETVVRMDSLRDALCRGIREPGEERLIELRHHLNELNDVLNRNHRAGASCGRALRKWFIVAALECADKPDMTGVALEMRRRIREVLRHRNDESVVQVNRDLR